MMTTFGLLKLAAGSASVVALNGVHSLRNLFPNPLSTVEPIPLNELEGTWYEIARKPIRIEKRSYNNISYIFRKYTNHQQHAQQPLDVQLTYTDRDGKLGSYHCTAEFKNASDAQQFKIHYLPYAILKNLKALQRQIFYYDGEHQILLIGEPSRKFLWLLARIPHLEHRIIEHVLDFAAEQGYDLSDVITVNHHI